MEILLRQARFNTIMLLFCFIGYAFGQASSSSWLMLTISLIALARLLADAIKFHEAIKLVKNFEKEEENGKNV